MCLIMWISSLNIALAASISFDTLFFEIIIQLKILSDFSRVCFFESCMGHLIKYCLISKYMEDFIAILLFVIYF